MFAILLTSARKTLATASNACFGHGNCQSMVVLFTKPGKLRHLVQFNICVCKSKLINDLTLYIAYGRIGTGKDTLLSKFRLLRQKWQKFCFITRVRKIKIIHSSSENVIYNRYDTCSCCVARSRLPSLYVLVIIFNNISFLRFSALFLNFGYIYYTNKQILASDC